MVRISVIIPTAGEMRRLAESLPALRTAFGEAAEENYEIIVSANGLGEDQAKALDDKVAELCGDPRITTVNTKFPGLLAGRHHGLQHARAEIVAFVDDDFLVGGLWVENVLRIMSDTNVGLCTGPARAHFLDSGPYWLKVFTVAVSKELSSLPLLSLIDSPNKGDIQAPPEAAFGQNFVSRKSLIYSLGGFAPDLMPRHRGLYVGGGETVLAQKIHASKRKIIFSDGLSGIHVIPESRTTIGYLGKRAVYDAYVASYSKYRKTGRLPLSVSLPLRIIENMGTFQKRISSAMALHNELKARFALIIYWTHFLFAQTTYETAVSFSNRLRSWVKLENYLTRWFP